jgi:hypothetical protein
MRNRNLFHLSVAFIAALAIASTAMAQGRGAKKARRAAAKQTAQQAAESPRYDVLYQVHVPTFAGLIAAKIQQGIHKDIAERKPHESEDAYAVRKLLGEGLADSLSKAVKELQTVSLGWRVDRAEKRSYIDLSFTAQPGTALARRFAEAAELKTAFAGFHLPDAALTAHWAGQTPPSEAQVWVKVVQTIRQRELAKIDRQSVSDQDKAAHKEVLNKLCDVLRDSAASGHSDGALSLVLKPKRVTLVAGAFVADGAKLQSALKTVAEHVQKHHPNFTGLKLDAGKYEGVSLSTLALPAPQGHDRSRFVEVFGESLEVVVGFGPKAVYVAAGRDAIKTLKEAIQKSAAPASLATPFEVSVALKPVADFVAALGRPHERKVAAKVAEILGPAGQKDYLSLVAKPIPRGVILRFDAEEGVLRLIGKISPEVKEFLLGK